MFLSVPADFFIGPSGTRILGMDLFTTLGLNIVHGCVTPASVLSTSVHQTSASQTSNPNVTGTLGYAKGFVHRVKIRPDVVPIQQKIRRLPFDVRDAVSQEVKMLEEAGIIERIDSSEWVSPIVVTHKKTGGIRLCMDLREPNKVIVIDSHPLP